MNSNQSGSECNSIPLSTSSKDATPTGLSHKISLDVHPTCQDNILQETKKENLLPCTSNIVNNLKPPCNKTQRHELTSSSLLDMKDANKNKTNHENKNATQSDNVIRNEKEIKNKEGIESNFQNENKNQSKSIIQTRRPVRGKDLSRLRPPIVSPSPPPFSTPLVPQSGLKLAAAAEERKSRLQQQQASLLGNLKLVGNRSLRVVSNIALSFPDSIYAMVTEASHLFPEVINWVCDGEAFVVNTKNETDLSKLIQKYFNHSRYSSLQRQLNMYGWKKHCTGKYKGAFYHCHFHRDRASSEAFSKIKRRAPPKRSNSNQMEQHAKSSRRLHRPSRTNKKLVENPTVVSVESSISSLAQESTSHASRREACFRTTSPEALNRIEKYRMKGKLQTQGDEKIGQEVLKPYISDTPGYNSSPSRQSCHPALLYSSGNTTESYELSSIATNISNRSFRSSKTELPRNIMDQDKFCKVENTIESIYSANKSNSNISENIRTPKHSGHEIFPLGLSDIGGGTSDSEREFKFPKLKNALSHNSHPGKMKEDLSTHISQDTNEGFAAMTTPVGRFCVSGLGSDIVDTIPVPEYKTSQPVSSTPNRLPFFSDSLSLSVMDSDSFVSLSSRRIRDLMLQGIYSPPVNTLWQTARAVPKKKKGEKYCHVNETPNSLLPEEICKPEEEFDNMFEDIKSGYWDLEHSQKQSSCTDNIGLLETSANKCIGKTLQNLPLVKMKISDGRSASISPISRSPRGLYTEKSQDCAYTTAVFRNSVSTCKKSNLSSPIETSAVCERARLLRGKNTTLTCQSFPTISNHSELATRAPVNRARKNDQMHVVATNDTINSPTFTPSLSTLKLRSTHSPLKPITYVSDSLRDPRMNKPLIQSDGERNCEK